MVPVSSRIILDRPFFSSSNLRRSGEGTMTTNVKLPKEVFVNSVTRTHNSFEGNISGIAKENNFSFFLPKYHLKRILHVPHLLP